MSRVWTPRTSVTGIRYGQAASSYYWDYPPNMGAYYDPTLQTYDLALPNCTTYAKGRILEAGDPDPTGTYAMPNANNWHSNLVNGWTYEAWSSGASKAKPGDIVEWSGSGQHVAVLEAIVNGVWYVSQSYYRPMSGGVPGTRDYRIWGSTKASVDAYGYANYPTEYFNYSPITSAYGTYPDFVLYNPNSHPAAGSGAFRFLGRRKKAKKKVTIYV